MSQALAGSQHYSTGTSTAAQCNFDVVPGAGIYLYERFFLCVWLRLQYSFNAAPDGQV